MEKAQFATDLLVEGNSIRSTARLAGMQISTVSALLTQLGADCSDLQRSRIRNMDVKDLELDEIWTFVHKKQKRVKPDDPDTVGNAYCYIALERWTKLILAWHLGKRDEINTCRFILKVREATSSKQFQISTDGWPAYEYAIERGLSDRASYGRIVKVTYPGRVEAVFGDPNIDDIETTFIERYNGTLRQMVQAHDPQDLRLLQEVGQAGSGTGARLRALQLLPDPPDAAHHARHGCGTHGSPVDDSGTTGGSVPVITQRHAGASTSQLKPSDDLPRYVLVVLERPFLNRKTLCKSNQRRYQRPAEQQVAYRQARYSSVEPMRAEPTEKQGEQKRRCRIQSLLVVLHAEYRKLLLVQVSSDVRERHNYPS